MNASKKKQDMSNKIKMQTHSSFKSLFFEKGSSEIICVPDYQRAFSWKEKQILLFIQDLQKYKGVNKEYYFGHFIVEDCDGEWEIVDGQQRITTFVLFLMVCQCHSPLRNHIAYSLIDRFQTVSYDMNALECIKKTLTSFLKTCPFSDGKELPSDEEIINGFQLNNALTRSQKLIVHTLLHFHQAFESKKLDSENINEYIDSVMSAHCSLHLTRDKSVAVNIFEMHNTRGVPLTTLEIIKAILMKFVYDYGGEDRESKVSKIQEEFGEIYGMEERLAVGSFRGQMTIEQLLRLHLRVIDDGKKRKADEFDRPGKFANADALVEYVNKRLFFIDGDKTKPEISKGVEYALNLTKEFKKSVRIISEILPDWDQENALVGDVLILEQELSCQLFLIVCRRFESAPGKVDGRIGEDVLALWEKLLFTRDFHDRYYNLRGRRDNFPALFTHCVSEGEDIQTAIEHYLLNGFRSNRTKDLQSIVRQFLVDNKENVLNNAFHWWKRKMTYAIYKYEISQGADLRNVMKGTISVEHILPQEWKWKWIEELNGEHIDLSDTEKDQWSKNIWSFINGAGNLLLLTPSENTTAGNKHPVDKQYKKYCSGGSYKEHDENREQWRDPNNWEKIIRNRGEKIFEFMMNTLLVEAKDE